MTNWMLAVGLGLLFAAIIIGVFEWARRDRSSRMLTLPVIELRTEYEKTKRKVLDAPCPPDNCTKEQIQKAVEKVKVESDGTVTPENVKLLGGGIRHLGLTGDGEGNYD